MVILCMQISNIHSLFYNYYSCLDLHSYSQLSSGIDWKNKQIRTIIHYQDYIVKKSEDVMVLLSNLSALASNDKQMGDVSPL